MSKHALVLTDEQVLIFSSRLSFALRYADIPDPVVDDLSDLLVMLENLTGDKR